MSTYAALAHTTWVGGYDMTTDLNQLQLDLPRDALVNTPFGSTAQRRASGFQDVQAQLAGFYDAADDAVDEKTFAAMGSTLQVVTHTVSGTELDVAYFYQAKQFNYEVFGQVGEMTPFSLQIQGARGNGTLSAGAVRGRLTKAKGNVSATGALGSGYQLGAVSSSQYLYGAFHIFSAGTTITVVLESDDNSGFSSATTRATLGPLTTTGGTWATRVAGSITDTYFRYRVTAITGTFSVAGSIGIK